MRLLVTDGGHGDHQEVDAVPVGQSLAVVEVRGVSRVLQEVDDAWGPVTLTLGQVSSRGSTQPLYTLHSIQTCGRQPHRDEHCTDLAQPAGRGELRPGEYYVM